MNGFLRDNRKIIDGPSLVDLTFVAATRGGGGGGGYFVAWHVMPKDGEEELFNKTLRWLYIVTCKSLQLHLHELISAVANIFSYNTGHNVYNQVSVALIYLRKTFSLP